MNEEKKVKPEKEKKFNNRTNKTEKVKQPRRVNNKRPGKKVVKKLENLKEDFKFRDSKLKIIPLGGIEEIGKNITVFEYENDIIVVDCGVAFPGDDMLGIDLVIPDFTYLEKNKEK